LDFQKFVAHYKPGFVVIENVPGFMSKKKESPLYQFLKFLSSNKYSFDFKVINALEFGIPQTRKRFLLIASRVIQPIIEGPKLNQKPTVEDFISTKKGFPILPAGFMSEENNLDRTAKLSRLNAERIRRTKTNGGLRTSYCKSKKLAIPSHYKNESSFRDSYGRMSWQNQLQQSQPNLLAFRMEGSAILLKIELYR
jgi:DNA (cytosine-5)-methyltransferase 1